MPFTKLAVIGGTGFVRLFNEDERFRINKPAKQYQTPYCDNINYQRVTVKENGKKFIFIDRHNCTGDFRLPHMLNHPAYMYALYKLGVKVIIATTAVGGIYLDNPETIEIGQIRVPFDYLDLTGLAYTFARKKRTHPLAFHRSHQTPFCRYLRRFIVNQKTILHGGTLGCTITGPRYETPAEIEFCIRNNLPLVGMNTVVGEIPLAIEASMHYLPICIITDIANGTELVDPDEVKQAAEKSHGPIIQGILEVLLDIQSPHSINQWACDCTKKPPVFDLVEGL